MVWLWLCYQFCSVVLWKRGGDMVVLWQFRGVEVWVCGVVVSWCSGMMVWWCGDALVVVWCRDLVVWWCDGYVGSWVAVSVL